MEKTQVVLFDRNNISALLCEFGFQIASAKSTHKRGRQVLTKDGNAVNCGSCEKPITENRVGTIAHGSRLLFCDNPVCFATWLAKNKIK